MEIRVPDLGDFADVEIVEVAVKPGDQVAAEDPLITLETDKAAMDVPAPAAGRIAELAVKVGDRVSTGDLIGILETADGTTADDARPAATEPAAAASGSTPAATAGASPAASAGSETAEEFVVTVPDLGDFDAADVAEVQIKPGDEVAAEDPLITLETDKAAMDVPSPAAGTVLSVAVQPGQKIGSGAEIARLLVAGGRPASAATAGEPPSLEDTQTIKPLPEAAAPPPPAAQAAGAAAEAPPPALAPIDERRFAKAHASPSVRKFARELGVDLGQVKGSGPKGRILQDDVKQFVKAILTGKQGTAAGGLPPLPKVDFAKYGEIEVRPLNRIKKISGPRLHASWLHYPHVTQFDEADITGLEGRRQRLKDTAADKGVKLTPLAFIIKACVIALQEFPEVNSSMSDDQQSLVYKKYYHIGFAADTPNGLVVPVIRDADLKDVMSIAQELGELSALARAGKLTAQQMQGGSFTVSSLGGIGGTHFTPIINAPEVAILGIGRASYRPVFKDGQFLPRLILPLSLSYDHRVIDGAAGVRFTSFLRELLGDVDRILLGSPG